MSPLKHSKSFAARMGRWSSSHWKTAVFGWLALVVLSVFVSIQVGTRYIDPKDANVGESRAADKIIADGGKPWCIGLGSGGATGWPATDWVEDIMLRTQAPEVYDKWTKNEIPFNDPAVVLSEVKLLPSVAAAR